MTRLDPAVAGSAQLPKLEVTLDLASTPPGVMCRLWIPAGPASTPASASDAKPAGEWRCSIADIHLPERLENSLSATSLTVPQGVVVGVKGLLAKRPSAALEIEIVQPSGYLGLVPWERDLQPALGLPVLRPPTVSTRLPLETPNNLDVALCASSPYAKAPFDVAESLLTAARSIVGGVTRQARRVHIFTDVEAHSDLAKLLDPALAAYVELHDPAKAAAYALAPAGSSSADPENQLLSPWLLWMRAETAQLALDIVHFISCGYVDLGRGLIALAPSPVGKEASSWSHFIGPLQLATFLYQTGAWATVLSSPPGGSDIGLRLLAERTARRQPFNVIHHDLSADAQGVALTAAYGFLTARPPVPAPGSPHLVLYCPPWWTATASSAPAPAQWLPGGIRYLVQPESDGGGVWPGARPAFRPLPREFFLGPAQAPPSLGERVAQLFSGERQILPWQAAAQRYLEQLVADIQRWREQGSASASDRREAEITGAEAAVEQIQQLILRHSGDH